MLHRDVQSRWRDELKAPSSGEAHGSDRWLARVERGTCLHCIAERLPVVVGFSDSHYRTLLRLLQPVLEEQPVCAAAMQLKGTLEYEQPNNQLYTFTGRMILNNDHSTTPLGPENIMLRGCGLRSCAFVLGLVIFTGAETKLLQNSRSAPSKQSKLYKTANRCMGLIFATMFLLCLISAIVAASWNHANDRRVWYLPFVVSNDAGEFVKNLFTFLILFNNLVPISLYVSLDIIKVAQAKNITGDDAMMFDGFRAIARTSELNEELGQIEYIFSDKTGTLTCNVMEFRKCSIGGTSYGFGTTEIGRAVAALQPSSSSGKVSQATATDVGVTLSMENSSSDIRERMSPVAPILDAIALETNCADSPPPQGDPTEAQVHYDPSISFDDPSLLRHLYAGGQQGALIHEFLTLLAICHTVIPEVDKSTGAVTYRASSPDEEALVKAAKCLGYNFVDPAPLTKIEITRKSLDSGKPEPDMPIKQSFTILNVNEFNSSRKRMSIVAVNEKNEYVLYCKGADNMVLARAVQDENTVSVNNHLRVFAGEGLRTLVLAKRVLTSEEYLEFNERYIDASTSLQDREEKLDAVAEMIEKEMQILGVTAIEDKLQESVPSTIFDLAQAGIKIWVLTGDREETAINIGHACRLINDRMKLLYVNQESIKDLEVQIEELHKAPFIQQLLKAGKVSEEIAMVCDGKALVHVFPSKDALAGMSEDAGHRAKLLASKLLDVASVCKALIACRVSPSQKAEIVSLVRNGSPTKPITLAIGDGANDVSMIQTAHVGVGICGKEGVQAVNASDYAIAQFKFLKRLVLIHGRFNYKRICKVIKYSFYKNIALVISLFLFNFFNGQSGAPLFESFVMAGWNFFLATPIIVIGVFDQDMPEAVVLSFPKLYRSGQRDSDLNIPAFATTIANATLHAFICFWVCYLCYNPNHSVFHMGTIFYTTLLLTMKWKVVLLTFSWNKYHLLFLAFSVWLFAFFLVVYPLLTFLSFDMIGVPAHMLGDDLFWYLLFVCPIAAILLDVTVMTMQQQFVPTSEDILRERYRLNASMRFSGKAGIIPDNTPSAAAAAPRKIGAETLVFPEQAATIEVQASSLSLLHSQIDMAKTHSCKCSSTSRPYAVVRSLHPANQKCLLCVV